MAVFGRSFREDLHQIAMRQMMEAQRENARRMEGMIPDVEAVEMIEVDGVWMTKEDADAKR